MKAKIMMRTLMTTALVLTLVSVSWAGPFRERVRDQREQIVDGVRSGEITDREYVRLNKEQWKIQKAIRRAKADGWISRRETRRIHGMQDRAASHIRRAMHNDTFVYTREPIYDETYPEPEYRHSRYPDPPVSSPPQWKMYNTQRGAFIGAGVGALAGQAIGRNTKSTLIGAGVGTLLGAVMGNAVDQSHRAAQEAARTNQTVVYYDERGSMVEAVPGFSNQNTQCRKVAKRVWDNGELIEEGIEEVCEGNKHSRTY